MARGWESKSVESQIENAGADTRSPRQHLTKEQRQAAQERQRLQLSRTYLVRQIAASPRPDYTQALQQALREIEEKLARLEDSTL